MDYSALLMTAITLITAQITVLDLGRFRFGKKKMFVILSLLFAVQVVVNGSLLMLGLKYYARTYILTVDLPDVLVFWYVSKRRDFRDLFTVLLTIFLSFSLSIPSLWILQLFEGNYWWYDLFRVIFYIIVLILLHLFIRKRYILIQDEIDKGWGMFCILPLIGSIILYYQYSEYIKTGRFANVAADCTLVILIMATVFAVFYYIFNQLHEKYIALEQKRILTMQNKAQRDQFEQQREAAEKTNRRWHDLRHNMQELIELLEAGDVETALAYLKEQRGTDQIPKESYCLNPAVNSILCLWAERARMASIVTEIHTDVPEKLEIDPMELSALFANAFENAYEGCLRLPDELEKYIRVEASYNRKRLAVGFTNSCIQDIRFENDMPVSQKQGGGIGTRSMAYTVQRFHGTQYFNAKDCVFTARFILNI